MTRDPFEHMKNSNPVPPGTEPSAPMSMAERIVGARSGGWPAWALTAVTAIAVLVVGLGSVWLLGGDGGDDVAGGETTTTAQTDTTATPTTGYVTTTLGPEYDFEAVVYFLADGVNDTAQSGPYLIPVAVQTSDWEQVTGTMVSLLAGPTQAQLDGDPAIPTAIPAGTVLRDVSVDGGIATVDISSEFQTVQGSFGTSAAIAQVVFTLTRFDEIDAVRFEIEGVPTTVFGGDGLELTGDLDREDFYPGIGRAWDDGPQSGLVPAVLIEAPAYESLSAGNPLVVNGIANVFEATVSLALEDSDGLVLWEGFTTASCGTGCWGAWSAEIPYEVDEPQMGSLVAWESSAMDGSRINVREHAVWLTPSAVIPGTTTTTVVDGTCSGSLVTDSLIPQPDLPEQNAEMRQRIFEAAVDCDWDTLRSLQIEGFGYSFGINEDAVAYWQELEAQGEEPIRYLAELLNRPYGVQSGAPGGPDYYVWPSAFVTEWSQVPQDERDALRPLYDDEDFAGFADFGGYFGYRVGIIDGSWVYFVAGD